MMRHAWRYVCSPCAAHGVGAGPGGAGWVGGPRRSRDAPCKRAWVWGGVGVVRTAGGLLRIADALSTERRLSLLPLLGLLVIIALDATLHLERAGGCKSAGAEHTSTSQSCVASRGVRATRRASTRAWVGAGWAWRAPRAAWPLDA